MNTRKLHNSHLSMLFACGEKFRRRYINGEREPQTSPLFVGSVVHKTVSDGLRTKLSGQPLPSAKELTEMVDVNVQEGWPDDLDEGLEERATKEGVRSDASAAVMAYRPVADKLVFLDAARLPSGQLPVEFKWVLTLEGLPYELQGEVDLLVADGADGYGIRDMKVRAKAASKGEADSSQQLSMYAMALAVLLKQRSNFVAIDTILKPGKRREAQVKSQESVRDEKDDEVVLNRIGAAIAAIESGVFLPANTDDWRCSEAFCGFARDGSCPYFRKRVVSGYSSTDDEGA